ncbi:MAG TPA: peptide ABC transporter substrate-binding protein [Candidatus Avipropionibacterium avicola]|uniref:Peptide ABC transporter substrate-binding protein n=1 Tax=Candidatus Avipropionibacterium avicola TaxID=2840701 RepID=A0A9D1GVU7_9ACTN|nr:peptide ABC transporter substrate-binding protein [Candidatus Avipropionibacterium avicola]
MTTRRQVLQWGGLAGGVSLAAASCGFQGSNSGGGDGDGGGGGGEKSLTIQGPVLPTLDPQVISDGMWMVNRGLIEGMLMQTDDGTDVQPAAAESWDMSDDGLVYTFHLREANWSDGSPVTADDFMYAYERLLEPKSSGAGVTLGANSYVSSMNIKNALQFQQGVVEDWAEVGIKSPDDKTIEITLTTPNQGFLMGMTHASMCPLPKKVLEEHDAEWEKPENIITNGPFTVEATQTNVSMTLVKNQEYWDADNVQLDKINYRMVEGSAAPTLVPFENGEVDIMSVGDPALLLRFDNDPNLTPRLHSAKPGSIYYLALLHSKNEVLSDIRIREALSLGMGRETAAQSVPKVEPTTSLVPQSVAGWEESDGIAEDIERAKQLLADAGFPEGKGLPPITILNGGNPSPIITTIMSNWEKNLGVKSKNDAVEAGVYVTKRSALNDDNYVGFYYGSFAAELNWSKWVGSLWSPTFTKPFSLAPDDYQEYLDLQKDKDLKPAELTSKLNKIANERCSDEVKKFDELTTAAMETVDPDEAVQAFKAAAKAREECFIFLPIGQGGYHFAVNERVTGFNPRPTGDQYYYKTLGVQ